MKKFYLVASGISYVCSRYARLQMVTNNVTVMGKENDFSKHSEIFVKSSAN